VDSLKGVGGVNASSENRVDALTGIVTMKMGGKVVGEEGKLPVRVVEGRMGNAEYLSYSLKV